MNVAKSELFALVLNLLSTDSGIFMGFLDFTSFLDCPFMFLTFCLNPMNCMDMRNRAFSQWNLDTPIHVQVQYVYTQWKNVLTF